MGLTYAIGIVIAALSAAWRLGGGEGDAFPRESARARRHLIELALLVGGLVGTLVVAFGVLDAATRAQWMPAWQRTMPLHMFTQNGMTGVADPGSLGTTMEAIALVQTALLVGVWLVLRRRPTLGPAAVAIVAAGAVAMAVLALRTAVAGPDIFAYVGFALSAHPYRPDATPLPAVDAVIGRMWGFPLPPSPYGPAWVALSHLLIGSVSGLGAQLLLFRGIGLCAMAASIGALVVAKRRLAAMIFAIDPTLWHVYVAEAHNDIVGVALVLVALALACRRRVGLAVVCVACAGAVKFPLVVLGLVAFVAVPALRTRIVACTSAVAGCVCISLLFGGRDYAWAVHRTTQIYPQIISASEWISHVALAAIAVGAVALAVVAGRIFWGASWSFVACGQFTAWQYLGWSIPYAVLDDMQGALYLACLPVTAFEATLIFNRAPFFDPLRTLTFATLLIALVVVLRRRAPAPTRTPAPLNA